MTDIFSQFITFLKLKLLFLYSSSESHENALPSGPFEYFIYCLARVQ